MGRSRKVLAAALILVAAAGVAVVVVKARRIGQTASQVADDIETQLGDLDPVTRAAVAGKLSSDAVQEIHSG